MSIARSAAQVSTQTIEGKYATALFRAANRQNTFRSLETDIVRLKSQLELDNGKIVNLLQSPLLTSSQKYRIVSPLVSKSDQSGTINKFIDIVASNGRLAKLSEILNSFIQICESKKQCSHVTVIVAKVHRGRLYYVGTIQTRARSNNSCCQ